MSPRYFGTDGIRAPFGEFPLDRPTVTVLGRQLGRRLGGPEATVVLGGDTRESTTTLATWLVDGLEAAGARWIWLGVVPTPAVAFLTVSLGADAGIAVSASHNLPPDNGIKLFDREGHKWAPAEEASLEGAMEGEAEAPPSGARLEPDRDLVARYLEHLTESLREADLSGTTLALDCAHGATAPFAADLFRALEATVLARGVEPDGTNINRECGSTHTEGLETLVRERSARFGFAFDGDGDRCLLVDETGTTRDGDAMLYLWALDLAERGLLDPREIVATSMSNLGLERALAPHGIGVVRCGVGDREVVATMSERGIALGGEQSGHLVCSHFSTTGDGMLTAVQLAEILAAKNGSVSDSLAGFRRFPQILHNVPVREKIPFEEQPGVQEAIREVEAGLGSDGRLVLRYSGTERLARIMIEGPDEEDLNAWAARIAEAIRQGQPGAPAPVSGGSG